MATPADTPPFAEAHAALLRDGALQFDLPVAAAPAAPAPPLHFDFSFGSVPAIWVLAGLAAALAVGLAVAYRRGSPAAPEEFPAAPASVPIAPAAARLALADADRLAAEGRHLDALRVLLACGLDAIARAHPGLLRPTTTSRDLAGEPALPGPLRAAFARIARGVETGLFAGRPVGSRDYADGRSAFVDSAMDGPA